MGVVSTTLEIRRAASNYGLVDLPLELILAIASYIRSGKDLFALSRANRILYHALLQYRYRRDVQTRPFSVLTWATQQRQHETARNAIEAGANATCSQPCCTVPSPLELAAQYNYDDMIALLVGAQGLDVNARSAKGLTPLCWAVAHRNAMVVRMLLTVEGVDVKARDVHGRTPLDIAVGHDDATLVDLLLQRGGDSSSSMHISEAGDESKVLGRERVSNGAKAGDIAFDSGPTSVRLCNAPSWASSLLVMPGEVNFARVLVAHGAQLHLGLQQ